MSNIIEEFNTKFVYISKQISNIDKSLSDHLALVNSLRRDICMFAEVRVNRKPNDMPISTQTFPLTGLHAREPLSIDHLARTGSASAHPPSMSLRNRSHPSPSPLVKNRQSLSYVKPRDTIPILSTEGYQSAGVTRVAAAHIKPNSILCLGDSNKRYVRLGGPHVEMRREPTYTIEAIDPHKVAGYQKVWIHVGINSLKRHHCRSMSEVKQKFDIFMRKISEIKSVSPHIKVIISPILPTAIPELNIRARYFNSLLFSQKRWWALLGFDAFCNSSGVLAPVYRRYKNQNDKIHLGYNGINLLASKLRAELSLVDGRSFASAVRGSSRPSLL